MDFGELAFDDGEFGAQERAVEADEHVAFRHAVAVAGEDLADDPAVGVLDDLPVARDLHHAARDDGAGDLGAHAPCAEAAHEERDGGEADGQGEAGAPCAGCGHGRSL